MRGDYLRAALNGPDLSAEMQSFAWPYLHPEKSTTKGKDKPEALWMFRGFVGY